MATLEEKKKVLSQLAFIHQRLTQTSQYFIDEFDIAKDSARTITEMFNNLKAEIDAEDAQRKIDEEIAKDSEVANEQG
jgi:hypothetical protein